MKINLLYFSPTGTTKKIIETISSEIENTEIKTYNLTQASNRINGIEFDSDDLVIIGVPVYAGRVPQILNSFFRNVTGKNTKAVFVVVYGNRDYEDALLELKMTFEGQGFIGVAGGTFIGEHSSTSKVATERPDKQDLEVARAFGKEINGKLKRNNNSEINVKGNYPYKELNPMPKIIPRTDENCINCGICVKVCPMDAINVSDVKDIDAEKCIRCCGCIKKCPTSSKQFNQEGFIKVVNMLESKFSTIRKEPEFFL